MAVHLTKDCKQHFPHVTSSLEQRSQSKNQRDNQRYHQSYNHRYHNNNLLLIRLSNAPLRGNLFRLHLAVYNFF